MGKPGTGRKLRVAIATLGRFHVLDLARELAALGHEVHLYTYVPRRRAERFGLPRKCHVALLPLLWPLVVLSRIGGTQRYRDWLDRAIYAAANWAVSLRLKPCDVFIGMSGVYLEAAEYARERFGAKIVVERGSRHILSQKEILDEIKKVAPDCATVPDWVVPRELRCYAIADLVVVPADHVADSFVAQSTPANKLFKNPYGVDLSTFVGREKTSDGRRSILFVGTWTYRKGVDVLVAAVEGLRQEFELIHVGPKGDAPFPRESWFRTVGPVPQWSLPDWYSDASMLVLPSREEGLALVQMQALACGCPIIVSDRSGGGDLKVYLEGRDMIDVVPVEDMDALRRAISRRLGADRAVVDASNVHVLLSESLSWSAYGKRYAGRLQSLVIENYVTV